MNTIIIKSIGDAKPSVSKILADSFKLPQEYFLKLIYNAPSVLFSEVEDTLAESATSVLSELGLEVETVDTIEGLSLNTELLDVSVYLEDISYLPSLIESLSEFLGCTTSDAFNLLLKEPAFILGSVSENTAHALSKRIPGKVCYSNPKKDKYTLFIESNKMNSSYRSLADKMNKKWEKHSSQGWLVNGLSYEQSQNIWRQNKDEEGTKIINETHQLCNILLTDFGPMNQEHRNFLETKIGIPDEIINNIAEALPIALCESIPYSDTLKLINECQDLGIQVEVEKLFNESRKIQLENIENLEEVNAVLNHFFSEKDLPKSKEWISPGLVPLIVQRYLDYRLSNINCTLKIKE